VPKVIGLTGNIACGKSTVAAMLRELGAQIVDADRVAHQVMAPPGTVFEAIVREFGPEVVAADGTLDRRRLGAIVFADPVALKRLDQLVHPHTGVAIRQIIADSSAAVVAVEAIKLVESGTYRVCDSVWLVTCHRDQQLERLQANRGLDLAEATRRVDAQTPASDKLPFADRVIDASGSLEETRRQVLEGWRAVVTGSR
jgi:dephospho-CoA kinase